MAGFQNRFLILPSKFFINQLKTNIININGGECEWGQWKLKRIMNVTVSTVLEAPQYLGLYECSASPYI